MMKPIQDSRARSWRLRLNLLFAGTRRITAGTLGLTCIVACVGPAAGICLVAASNAQSQAQLETGGIVGQLTAGDTNLPIRGADVTLMRLQGGGLLQVAAAKTDDNGRFEFSLLPPGTYELSAAADGYIPVKFGQRLPTNLSRRIELAKGLRFENADITLSHKSAIEGRVMDSSGVPQANVAVQIVRVGFAAGKTRMFPAADGNTARMTDDTGRFRVFGLLPGDYYVVALPGIFAGLPGGSPTQLDMPQRSDSQVSSHSTGFVPTFYPGVAEPMSAQPVHLDAGIDATGLSFSLVSAKTAIVSGVVLDYASKPLAQVILSLFQLHGGDIRTMIATQTRSAPDGSFSFSNVPLGNYVIQANAPGDTACGTGFGSLVVPVDQSGARNLVVQTVGSSSVAGSIEYDGLGLLPLAANVRLRVVPTDLLTSPVFGRLLPTATSKSDQTFVFSGLCGAGVLRVVTPQDWLLKSVVRDGTDVTDTPIDFARDDVKALVVTLTSNTSSLGGRVLDASGQPVAGSTVVVFAEDPTKWVYPSRYLFDIPADAGVFTSPRLLPGTYFVTAVRSPLPADWQDAKVLGAFRALAMRVVIGPAETKMVDLKIGK